MNRPKIKTASSRQQGFTLTELIVTVTIIGILASIAYPAYQGYLQRGRRTSAQAHLMDIAQRQQQYLLDARAYAASVAALNMGGTPNDVSTYYDIFVTATAAPSFTATATPKGTQATDKCGTLTINNTGNKSTSTGASGCW